MTSNYTTRNRILKQGAGDSINLWGDLQSSGDFDLTDYALDGLASFDPTGGVTLTTANGTTTGNQASARVLKMITATVTATTTLPALEHWYLAWNATTAAQTIASSGGGTTVSIAAGEIVPIFCDATNVKRLNVLQMSAALDMGSNKITSVTDPTSNQDAATKKYVDNVAFVQAAGALPGQTGNDNKFLQTVAAAAQWAYAVNQGAGLASVTNNILTVTSATAAHVRTGTTVTEALTPGDTYNALAEVVLTDAATVAVDMSTFINANVTLAGNRTLGNPTNPKVGQTGYIRVIQDGTGSRTLAFASNWKRQGGAPTLTTTAAAVDVLIYQVLTPTYILYDVKLNPS